MVDAPGLVQGREHVALDHLHHTNIEVGKKDDMRKISKKLQYVEVSSISFSILFNF